MVTINFPANPQLNDTYTFLGRTWIYNGIGWVVKPDDITAFVNKGGDTMSGKLTITSGGLSVSGTTSLEAIETSSQTLVDNLNADFLDGQEGAFYRNASNLNAGTLALLYGGTGSTTAAGARTNLGAAALAGSSTQDFSTQNLTVSGTTYNMLTLSRTTANGASILFQNSSGNLGKLGFDGSGNLIIGKGATTDGVADLLKITPAGVTTFYDSVTASSFIKSGGTSSQFLKADGTVDSNAYLPLTGGTITGSVSVAGSITNLSNNGGGIFWNPYAESVSDGSDVASISVATSGGSTVMSIKQMNDANDYINFLVNSNTNGVRINGNAIYHAGNIPTWNQNTTGNAATATYAENSSKLYSTDTTYKYGGGSPYYGYLSYTGSRWRFQMSPATPAAIEVAYADVSGSTVSAQYLPTKYDGGVKTNPQDYFSNTIGLRVAMTGAAGTWTDTLWINGYSGGDVLSMCALHTSRQGTPKMWISNQNSTSTTYGTLYEFLTSYNVSTYALPIGGGTLTGSLTGTTASFSGGVSAARLAAGYDSGVAGAVSCNNWFRSSGATGWYNQTYYGGIYMTDETYVRIYNNKSFWVDGNIVATGEVTGQSGVRFGAPNSSNPNKYGVSFRSDWSPANPLCGMYFGSTVDSGTHGAVTGNGALYFTIDDTTNRGWIFRQNFTGVEQNVASISNTGNMSLNGYLQVQGGSSVPGIKSSYYGDIGMYFGDKLQYQSTSGIKEFIMTSRIYNINPVNPTYTQYNRVPVILWHGKVIISSSTVTFLMYNSGGISLTGSRLNVGTATITMNAYSGALLPNSYSEYMVIGTGLGTSNTTGSTAYITIPDTYKYANNFRLVISDDSTANDGYAEIMIIKVMDPAYYAS